MVIDDFLSQIEQYTDALPPVERWQPTKLGEIDIRIANDGQWYYQGSVFTRPALVRLLASVLIKQDGHHYLVTPVEKMKIHVDEVPFVITQWSWVNQADKSTLLLTTNIGEQLILDNQKQWQCIDDVIYIKAQRGLLAKLHRNVFYQWVDLATEKLINGHRHLVITSADTDFDLGAIT